jgi:hypothetical protein
MVAPSPAFSRSSGAGTAAADFQALESLSSLVYQFTGAELQALFCQVKDLLEANGKQPVLQACGCAALRVSWCTSFCDQRVERVPGHVGKQGSHTLQCLVCKARNCGVALRSMRAHIAAHILRGHVTSDVRRSCGLHTCSPVVLQAWGG